MERFQSTHSVTECDPHRYNTPGATFISIHALRYRVRLERSRYTGIDKHNFNPRTPLQSAMTLRRMVTKVAMLFQSTHSVTECDQQWSPFERRGQLFQSTHSVTECDRKILWFKPKIQLFYAILRLKTTNHASQMSPNET